MLFSLGVVSLPALIRSQLIPGRLLYRAQTKVKFIHSNHYITKCSSGVNAQPCGRGATETANTCGPSSREASRGAFPIPSRRFSSSFLPHQLLQRKYSKIVDMFWRRIPPLPDEGSLWSGRPRGRKRLECQIKDEQNQPALAPGQACHPYANLVLGFFHHGCDLPSHGSAGQK